MFEEINHNRRRFIGTVAMTVAAAQLGMIGSAKAESSAEVRLPVEGRLPSLGGAPEWLNSQPLTVESLRGKVVLVDFWTFSCINSLRTLPYIRAWAAKYKDMGLVIIGIQAP